MFILKRLYHLSGCPAGIGTVSQMGRLPRCHRASPSSALDDVRMYFFMKLYREDHCTVFTSFCQSFFLPDIDPSASTRENQ